jgi:hypothetical protein
MIDLVPQYYTKLTGMYRQWYQPGQFFEAPSLFLIDKNPMHILSAKYDSKSNTYSYGIIKEDHHSFKQQIMPIQPLGIKSNERIALVGCKMRPVIIISKSADCWNYGKKTNDECFLVAPVYSLEENDGSKKYPTEFIEKIKAYAYNTFFYLPKSLSPYVRESYVRFDRIQSIHKSWLQHEPNKLTPEAMECLLAWLYCYLIWDSSEIATLSKICELVLEYRAEKLKVLGLI